MQMHIRPIRQEFSTNCTSACLRMVLSYYNHPATRYLVEKDLLTDSDGTTFETELARYARLQGFEVDCYAYNLYLTAPSDRQLTKKQLLTKLNKELEHPWLKSWQKPKLTSIIRCLEAGVNYIIQRPRLAIMTEYLQQSIPLIITVNPVALYDRQGDPERAHEIVPSGVEHRHFYYVDPETASVKKIAKDHLFFAMLARKFLMYSAYLVAIKPKSAVKLQQVA
jgi:hypothetical protein